MHKIEDIRRLGRVGVSVASIARNTGVSEPTVRKYLREGDLSERPPEVGRSPRSPILEPYADAIDSWLAEDRRCWRKQRHTARRVYDRLVEEMGFEGLYSTVQRYVKRRCRELAAGRDAREAQGFLLLDWLPGECQVDFGQADFRVRGVVQRGHFLVVEFPHSNVGLVQVFWGETAECVCQGLKNVFEFLGGVPLRAVFDNAIEIGRRVGAAIVTSELFRRFAAHYGLDYSFTNPYSDNEKGDVENKVGAIRRNLFVPVIPSTYFSPSAQTNRRRSR
ncbi:IS21 family transposase [Enorma phocaeensis]|uniref:IS21 family transposase n=1 Tax=Enorma phocaeensis TaxID=1871019 RepID=A0A921LUX3_9ACTN|nr:IS21 family transposase [Enorma phocaeensis]